MTKPPPMSVTVGPSFEKLGFANEGPTVTDIGGGFVMDDYILALNMTK